MADGPPVAKPVVFMLVRSITDRQSSGTLLRTKLGVGIVNNETVAQVTERSKWDLGAIIGRFDNLDQANRFLQDWHGAPGTPAQRGPMRRIARGLALAELYNVTSWIDFTRLLGKPLIGWNVIIEDEHVIAYDLTQLPELVKA